MHKQHIAITPLQFVYFRLWKFIILSWCCMSPSLIAATQITAEQLVNNAYADGAMIATANVCHIDKAQLNQLIFKQKKTALDTAKQYQLPFLAKDYDDYVISGFESTMRMLSEQNEEDLMASICDGMQEKIAKKIAP